MSNVEIVTNIDIASEIAHATVTEVFSKYGKRKSFICSYGSFAADRNHSGHVNNLNLKEQDKATKEVA